MTETVLITPHIPKITVIVDIVTFLQFVNQQYEPQYGSQCEHKQ